MIPDHLIDKAWFAYIRSSNMQAIRNEMAYPDLRGPTPPPPDPRQSLRAALEAVAADIWDQGYEARQDEEASARVEYGTTFTDIIPNPYRASEG